jgi:hypothetical protein
LMSCFSVPLSVEPAGRKRRSREEFQPLMTTMKALGDRSDVWALGAPVVDELLFGSLQCGTGRGKAAKPRGIPAADDHNI